MSRFEELKEKILNATTKGEIRKIETECAVAHSLSRDIRDSEADYLQELIEKRLHEGAKQKRK